MKRDMEGWVTVEFRAPREHKNAWREAAAADGQTLGVWLTFLAERRLAETSRKPSPAPEGERP